MKKRPIDLQRESAGGMTVGLPEEGEITGLFKFGDEQLLILKEHAAYEFKFADAIDPERTNATIPNVQQRVITAGSSSLLVQRVLLTADCLINDTYLSSIDCASVRNHALLATKEILSMERIFASLKSDQKNMIDGLTGKQLTQGFIVPSLEDAEQSIKNFFLRSDHFCREIFYITRKFENRFKDLDWMIAKVKSELSAANALLPMLEETANYLKFIRNARNAVEHPLPQKRLRFFDFELTPNGQIRAPTIEIVHPKTGQPKADLLEFLNTTIDSLSLAFGNWLAFLCSRNAKLPGFGIAVMQLAAERRRLPEVKFSYAVRIGDQWQPLS